MKELYLEIMERSLSAYTPEGIREYIDEVKRDGLTEHGFPRLGVNLGILLAYGRRRELLDTFIEIMDLCCEGIPRRKAANDFSVREVCCCLMLLEEKGLVSGEYLKKWKNNLATFDPWNFYNVVDDHSGRLITNWALFAAVSEYMRGICCGINTTEFVDWQLPSQFVDLDCNGMYMDQPPLSNHMVYDITPRALMAFLLRAGYRGKYAAKIEQVLDQTADLTLKMQSVTGELAFGGRSNQFLLNEATLSSYCEMEAVRFAEKGDMIRAGEFKAAAVLAAESVLQYLKQEPISHVKNRYDVSTKIGCEDYAYFNKYMITVASNMYMGLMYADDSIIATQAPALQGGYVLRTSERFHKTFLCAGGYQLELETNGDFFYDANGLGRVHKAGCPGSLCLSHPFTPWAEYQLENKNWGALSLCCYAMQDGRRLLGAERYAEHIYVGSESDGQHACAVFDVKLSRETAVRHTYQVSENGVDITLSGEKEMGFMVPVFDFDGVQNTTVTVRTNLIEVQYRGAVCRYSFAGEAKEDCTFSYHRVYNRNGSYRVYQLASRALHIEMETI